jgi:hypothetical protein
MDRLYNKWNSGKRKDCQCRYITPEGLMVRRQRTRGLGTVHAFGLIPPILAGSSPSVVNNQPTIINITVNCVHLAIPSPHRCPSDSYTDQW